MANTIVHFEIPADDPEKIGKFYAELFDWKIEKSEGPTDYWLVGTREGEDQPGVDGGIFLKESPELAPVNYVGVDSVEEYVKKAESLGAQVVYPRSSVPQQGWFAQILDPEGNLFALWEADESAPMPEETS